MLLTDSVTVSIDDLPNLIEGEVIEQSHYLKAISFLRDGAFWKRWAITALLALAVGHILSGVIFFFAFNWNGLGGMTKFAIVGAGIIASLSAWVLAKLDSPVGKACGVATTVLVGVMFAVFGQVYQTPAMIHTPFVFWAILTLPFALASRNLAHWTVWLAVLVVAISTYANSGLRLAGNGGGANTLNVIVSAGFIAALVLLDKVLAPRMTWLHGEWFRVLLVLGAVIFAFAGFTESFWERNHGGGALWILALALIIGFVAYLNYLKPSLATLSLATFGGFTLIAQFGMKLIEGSTGGVDALFVMFAWFGGLTVGMVALFGHYSRRLKATPKEGVDHKAEEEIVGVKSIEFSNYMELESSLVTEFIESSEGELPWYMSVFLAIAGILTAILGCAFSGFFIALFWSDASGYLHAMLGSFIFGLAIVLRRMTKSHYVQHMLNTMIMVGGTLAAFGFGNEIKNSDGVIALLLILSVLVFISVRDRIMEFLSAAAIITLIGVELYHLKIPMAESLIVVISTVCGVVLLTKPIGKRLYHAAGTAFLMAPAVLGIALVHAHRWETLANSAQFSDGLFMRFISLLILLGAVAYLNRGKTLQDFKPPRLVLIPLVIAAAFVPLGGGSALLLMLTGYILGSRNLAVIGTLLQIYFLTMFYYDLSLGLLTKSIILFFTGVMFLGVWVFVNRREGAAS